MELATTIAAEAHVFAHEFAVGHGDQDCPAGDTIEFAKGASIGGVVQMLQHLRTENQIVGLVGNAAQVIGGAAQRGDGKLGKCYFTDVDGRHRLALGSDGMGQQAVTGAYIQD